MVCDISHQRNSYMEWGHILIMIETTNLILGTKVKFINVFLYLSSSPSISQFGMFFNVMIFEVNLINFHDTNEIRQIILIEFFFSVTFSNLSPCVLEESCCRHRLLVGLMGPFPWFRIPGKQIAAALTVK